MGFGKRLKSLGKIALSTISRAAAQELEEAEGKPAKEKAVGVVRGLISTAVSRAIPKRKREH